MPSPTVCTVSGVIRDTSGTLLPGTTVKANLRMPFIHTTDSSLIVNYEVTTTTDANGAWSLNLVETTTNSVTMTVTIFYATGSTNPNDRKEYTVTVPNSASATFATLISGQV